MFLKSIPGLSVWALWAGLTAVRPAPSLAQSASQAFQLDSLRRVIGSGIYSEADKKEIRGCDRDKTQFLKRLRDAKPEYAETDRAITAAKLRGADPNDPAVAALLEKKFTFEQGFDEQFNATARGKKCAEGDKRRAKALEAALKKHRQYQALSRQAEPPPGDAL